MRSRNRRMWFGRMLYRSDGTLRLRAVVAGVAAAVVPALILIAFTMWTVAKRKGFLRGRSDKPKQSEKVVVEKAKQTTGDAVAKGASGRGEVAPGTAGSGDGAEEIAASLRADARRLVVARDPASVAAWERLLQWDPENFDDADRCWYGVALCENGDLSKGGRLITWLLERLPDDVDVQAAAGRYALLSGDAEAAERHFRRALELGGGHGEGADVSLLGFASSVDTVGVVDEAGRERVESGDRDRQGDDAAVVAQLRADAVRMTISGEAKAAVVVWERLLRSDPEGVADADRHWYAVALCESGALEDGEALIELLLSTVPESADLLAAAGRCAFAGGKKDVARRHLERALELDPDHVVARRWLGELDRPGGLLVTSSRRSGAGGGVGTSGRGGGRAGGSSGLRVHSGDRFGKAAGLSRGEADEVARLRADALALMSKGDPQSMAAWERLLRSYIEEFTDSDRCWYAVSLCENGKLAEGGEMIDLLVSRLPETGDVHAAAGRCAYLRGNGEAAWWHLGRALELDDEHAHARRWFREIRSSRVLAPVFVPPELAEQD